MLDEIRKSYKKAEKRVIFLDYDGTLVPFSKFPSEACIDNQTLEVIKNLSGSGNRIIIISGRDKEFLESQFTAFPVDLIAEHGFMIKENGKSWSSPETELSWKEPVRELFQKIRQNFKGTFVEEKVVSFALHYRNAEATHDEIRSLIEMIHMFKVNHPELEVLEGHKVIEVKRGGYNKGTAAILLLDQIEYDFLLAIGDDVTDETLFRELRGKAFTIKVGDGISEAGYRLARQEEVLPFLKSLIS